MKVISHYNRRLLWCRLSKGCKDGAAGEATTNEDLPTAVLRAVAEGDVAASDSAEQEPVETAEVKEEAEAAPVEKPAAKKAPVKKAPAKKAAAKKTVPRKKHQVKRSRRRKLLPLLKRRSQ